MNKLKSIKYSLVVALALAALPVAAQQREMSRFVAVGDSLVAGSQSVGLEGSSQVNGFAAVIARQAGTDFPLPLVQYPGAPPVLGFYPDGSIGPVAAPALVWRVNPTVVPFNLAVPSFTLRNTLEYRPNASVTRSIGDRGPLVLGIPGVFTDPKLEDCPTNPRPACIGKTMIEQAIERKPTTTLVWVGNNDALLPAMLGQLSLLTKVTDFASDFRKLMSELQKTKSKLVVGTIPDVTAVPYFRSAIAIAEQYGLSDADLQSKLGLSRGDYVRRSALPIIDSIIKTGSPAVLPAMCPPAIYVFPFDVPCRLVALDVAKLRLTTAAYNSIIAVETLARGGVLVNTKGLVDDMAKNGYVVGDRRLTTDFLGGLFSLDGVHPSNTGYAVIANFFIDEMNRCLKLHIPKVLVESVFAVDPLRNHVPVIPAN